MYVPVFKGNGCLEYEERPHPHPVNDDVVVEVQACGICGTDLNILAVPAAHTARTNIVIGHEVVGIVRELGSGASLKVGDKVVLAPRITCGTCWHCRMGVNNQCTNYQTIGTTRDGGFAPYIVVPQSTLYPINVPTEQAVFFEPLSCVVGAVRRVPFQPGQSVVIIGAGPMGLLFALLYRAMGAGYVAVADISPHRLKFARSIDLNTFDLNDASLEAQVKAASPLGAAIVVDAVGNQIAAALTAVQRAGHVILFGLRAHDTSAVPQYAITRYDVTLHGVFVGLNPFIDTVQILERGVVDPSVLITHTLPLAQLEKGVAFMRSGEAMKVVIAPQT